MGKDLHFSGKSRIVDNCAQAQTPNLVRLAATADLLSFGHLFERWYIYHGY